MSVTNLNVWKENKELALQDAYFERQARALGFRDFAELEDASEAAFEAAMDLQQKRCTHPDKHPSLGMCEDCMSRLQY